MIETDAAMRRADRADELVMVAAWLTASLQRAKKIPPLKKLFAKDDTLSDFGFYLDGLKERLPAISLADWCASPPRTESP